MAFIAATWEIGSMSLNFDKQLNTDKMIVDPINLCDIKEFPEGKITTDLKEAGKEIMMTKTEGGVKLKKGEEIGMFNYGSTILMLFEAKEVDWLLMPGDFVTYGQGIVQSK